MITVDKNPAYSIAIQELKDEKHEGIQLRRVKNFNNIVEKDHWFIKRSVRSMLGLKAFKQLTLY